MAPKGGRPPDALTGATSPAPSASTDRARAWGSIRPFESIPTVEERLFEDGSSFDFFQAVRLLQKLSPERSPVGHGGPSTAEAVRFRTQISLSFPPSSIYEVGRPNSDWPSPIVVQSFLGLTGPSGVLPRHYTELLIRLEKDVKGPERYALRDWLDLFTHRLVSHFYRAWEKYRLYIPFERGEYDRPKPDVFTRSLFSLAGLGLPSLRGRLHVESAYQEGPGRGPVLARIDDLVLIHYAGLLAHRPRNAVGLETLLGDYFQLPVRVCQFQGRWLQLERENWSSLGGNPECNNRLGAEAVIGEQVWDRQSTIRLRLGPLRYEEFIDFLPDRGPSAERKAFFLLAHLVRLYAGTDLDFDVQLILRAQDVPECRLASPDEEGGRLGWNTWLCSLPFTRDVDDGVFEGEEIFRLGRDSPRDPDPSEMPSDETAAVMGTIG